MAEDTTRMIDFAAPKQNPWMTETPVAPSFSERYSSEVVHQFIVQVDNSVCCPRCKTCRIMSNAATGAGVISIMPNAYGHYRDSKCESTSCWSNTYRRQ